MLRSAIGFGIVAAVLAPSLSAQDRNSAFAEEISGPKLNYLVISNFPDVPPEANFGEVAAVAVDRRGHLFVFNRGPRPLMEFDASGRYVGELAQGLITHAHGLRFDREGFLWLVDDFDHHVIKLDRHGRVAMVLGRRGFAGASEDLFNRPTDVAVNSRGEIFVADGYINSRVVKYSADGRFILAWGSKGAGPGQFDIPHAIVIDSRDRVYVADRENHRIQIFDADGRFLTQWRGFHNPQGLYLTKNGSLYVGDTTRVVKVDGTGRVVGVLGSRGRAPGEFMGLHGLAVGPKGELFTAELNWRLQKFVPSGSQRIRQGWHQR